MVSHRDLQNVVEQINQSYATLLQKVEVLEAQVLSLSAPTTKTTKSKEKSWLLCEIML